MKYIEESVIGQFIGQFGLNTQKSVDFTGSPSVAFPSGTTIGGSAVAALGVVTSTSANAISVGAHGTTNPVLNVDASTSSVATGLNIKGAAAGSGVAVVAISSGTNESLTINGKGTGLVTINSAVVQGAGGSLAASVRFTSAGTGIFAGTGVPTIAAPKGSLYVNSTASTSATRLYVNTDGSTTWSAFTSAA